MRLVLSFVLLTLLVDSFVTLSEEKEDKDDGSVSGSFERHHLRRLQVSRIRRFSLLLKRNVLTLMSSVTFQDPHVLQDHDLLPALADEADSPTASPTEGPTAPNAHAPGASISTKTTTRAPGTSTSTTPNPPGTSISAKTTAHAPGASTSATPDPKTSTPTTLDPKTTTTSTTVPKTPPPPLHNKPLVVAILGDSCMAGNGARSLHGQCQCATTLELRPRVVEEVLGVVDRDFGVHAGEALRILVRKFLIARGFKEFPQHWADLIVPGFSYRSDFSWPVKYAKSLAYLPQYGTGLLPSFM